jgi:hypothetical protein
MLRNTEAPRVAAPEASWNRAIGYTGNATSPTGEETSIMLTKYSTSNSPQIPQASRVTGYIARLSALAKIAIVAVLAWLLAWRPTVALALGRLVLRVWPNFRRA